MIYKVLFALSQLSQSEKIDHDIVQGSSKMDSEVKETSVEEYDYDALQRAARKLLSSIPTDKNVYNEVFNAINMKDDGVSLGNILQSNFKSQSLSKLSYVLETVYALTDSIIVDSNSATERRRCYALSFENVAPVLLDILCSTLTTCDCKDSEIRRSICVLAMRLLEPFILGNNDDTLTVKRHDLVEPVKSMRVYDEVSVDNECIIEGVTFPKDAIRDFAVSATSRVIRVAAIFSKSKIKSDSRAAYDAIVLAFKFNELAASRCKNVSQASAFAELQPKDVLDAFFGSILCKTVNPELRSTLMDTKLLKFQFYRSKEENDIDEEDGGEQKSIVIPLSINVAIQDCLDVAEENAETSHQYFLLRKISAEHLPARDENPQLLQFLDCAFKREVKWLVELAKDPRAANYSSEDKEKSRTERLGTLAVFADNILTICEEDAIILTKALLLRGLFPEIETVLKNQANQSNEKKILLSSPDSRELLDAGKCQLSTKFTPLFGDVNRRQHAFKILTCICKKSEGAMALTLGALYRLHLFDQMNEENRDACEMLDLETEELDVFETLDWNVEPHEEIKRHVSSRGHPLPANVSAKIGLVNAGATCYMNALFQQLFAQPGIRDKILAIDSKVPEAERDESLFYQTQKMFAMLKGSSVANYFEPDGIWHAFKDWDGEPVNVREHEDALVFFTRFQEQIDSHYVKAIKEELDITNKEEEENKTNEAETKLPKIKGAIEGVLGFKMVNQIICKNCPKHRSEREEDFTQISLDVGGKYKACVEDSLSIVTAGELMDADNKWECSECGKLVDATKRVCMRTLPETLCLHIKRLEYDYAMDQRNKVKDYYSFPKTLDMYPYTEEALEKADQMERLDASEDDANGPSRPSTPGLLKNVSRKSMRNLLNIANNNGESGDGNENNKADDEKREYMLSGVIVHSGTAFAGHYYSFIRDRDESTGELTGDDDDLGTWRRYDDTSVEQYDPRRLEDDCFGGSQSQRTNNYGEESQVINYEKPNSAYILFYEKKNKKAEEYDSQMVDVPKESHQSVSLNMNPEIALMVEKENLSATYRANLFEQNYFQFALEQLNMAEQLLTSAIETKSNGAPKQAVIGTRKTSRVSQSAVRASSSDADGDGQKQPDEEHDAESISRGAKCARFVFHFYIRVYARADSRLQNSDEKESAEWSTGLQKLSSKSSVARLEFMRIADKYKVDLIAALTRCEHVQIRDCLFKCLSNCLKFTLSNDKARLCHRLLEQKKNQDFQSLPGEISEIEHPEAWAAYGLIDTCAYFFRQCADTEANFKEMMDGITAENNKFTKSNKLKLDRKRKDFISSCYGRQIANLVFLFLTAFAVDQHSKATTDDDKKSGRLALVHVFVHHMSIVPGLIWRFVGTRLQPYTQENQQEQHLLLTNLKRFFEQIHFSDDGSPPPSRRSNVGGEDVTRASLEITEAFKINIESFEDACVLDDGMNTNALDILLHAQLNSIDITNKVLQELFRFYTMFTDCGRNTPSKEKLEQYRRVNKMLFKFLEIADDLQAQRTQLIMNGFDKSNGVAIETASFGISHLFQQADNSKLYPNLLWDIIRRLKRVFQGKSGTLSGRDDEDDTEDVDVISDRHKIVANNIFTAVRERGNCEELLQVLKRLYEKFDVEAFRQDVEFIYRQFEKNSV